MGNKNALPPLLALMEDQEPPPLPQPPGTIVVGVSGGIDSVWRALWAQQTYPATPIVLWHAHLEQMDWSRDDTAISMAEIVAQIPPGVRAAMPDAVIDTMLAAAPLSNLTDALIARLARVIGTCQRVTVQAVYELDGTQTPSGPERHPFPPHAHRPARR